MPTTTCHLQISPDYYTCPLSEIPPKTSINTNPRYKRFNQIHFTAGDEQQFQNYISRENDSKKNIKITKKFHISQLNVELYHNLDKKYIDSTFRYLFHKFKKGIFVKIHSGELRVFLPFSKANFTNEWHQRILPPTEFSTINDFIKFACHLGGFSIADNKINAFVSSWYSNNCLLRHEFPPREGDSGLGGVRDMLVELCRTREVPDIEFFINKRDFPLLKKDLTEPYESLYNNRTLPLLSFREVKYYPILSMTTAPEFADIPIPTLEDWARVANIEDGKLFIPPRSYKYNFNLDFATKKPIAVFRGASTGEGTDTATNMRLKLAEISSTKIIDQVDGLPYLDAGITKWNTRIRKEFGKNHLTTIDYNRLPFGLAPPISPEEQSNYKYIINIDGHCSAFRLSLEFGMGAVVLLVSSRYKLWFHDMIKPWVHYVPVRADLGDLIERIKWCKTHEGKCKKIVENAMNFYREVLSKEGILDYMQSLLEQLRKVMGYPSHYNKYTVNQIQQYLISKNLKNSTTPALKTTPNPDNLVMDRGGVQIYRLPGGDCLKYVEKGGDKYVFKYWESLNEIFTSMNCLNGVRQYIPNFPKIYEYYFDDTVVIVKKEWADGSTLDDWIKSSQFNMTDFVYILLQINLSLFFVQSLYGFIHFDLYPWNIVIRGNTENAIIQYPWIDGKIISIQPKFIPYIIDYGKSSVVYRCIRYGSLKYCTIHDTLTNLLSTLFEVVRNTNQVGLVLRLANFVSNTSFRPNPFHNLRDLRLWLKDAKKYDNMLVSEKYELTDRTPVDFINYIQQQFNLRLSFSKRVIPKVVAGGGDLDRIVGEIDKLDLENPYVIYNLGKIFHLLMGNINIKFQTRDYLLQRLSSLKLGRGRGRNIADRDNKKIDYQQFADLDSGLFDKNIKLIQMKKVREYMNTAEIYLPTPQQTMEIYSHSTYLFYKLILQKTNC